VQNLTHVPLTIAILLVGFELEMIPQGKRDLEENVDIHTMNCYRIFL